MTDPSPYVEPFTAPLNIMPVAQPIDPATLDPQPEPARHQRYDDFPPQRFYEETLSEFRWKYHWQPPYGDGTEGVVGRDGDPDVGSWHWGFNGITPGETYHARYGDPYYDNWVILSNDGNLLERPLAEPMFNLWVASRFDVIVDFSRYRDGDKIQVWNDLGMPAS